MNFIKRFLVELDAKRQAAFDKKYQDSLALLRRYGDVRTEMIPGSYAVSHCAKLYDHDGNFITLNAGSSWEEAVIELARTAPRKIEKDKIYRRAYSLAGR